MPSSRSECTRLGGVHMDPGRAVAFPQGIDGSSASGARRQNQAASRQFLFWRDETHPVVRREKPELQTQNVTGFRDAVVRKLRGEDCFHALVVSGRPESRQVADGGARAEMAARHAEEGREPGNAQSLGLRSEGRRGRMKQVLIAAGVPEGCGPGYLRRWRVHVGQRRPAAEICCSGQHMRGQPPQRLRIPEPGFRKLRRGTGRTPEKIEGETQNRVIHCGMWTKKAAFLNMCLKFEPVLKRSGALVNFFSSGFHKFLVKPGGCVPVSFQQARRTVEGIGRHTSGRRTAGQAGRQ